MEPGHFKQMKNQSQKLDMWKGITIRCFLNEKISVYLLFKQSNLQYGSRLSYQISEICNSAMAKSLFRVRFWLADACWICNGIIDHRFSYCAATWVNYEKNRSVMSCHMHRSQIISNIHYFTTHGIPKSAFCHVHNIYLPIRGLNLRE